MSYLVVISNYMLLVFASKKLKLTKTNKYPPTTSIGESKSYQDAPVSFAKEMITPMKRKKK